MPPLLLGSTLLGFAAVVVQWWVAVELVVLVLVAVSGVPSLAGSVAATLGWPFDGQRGISGGTWNLR